MEFKAAALQVAAVPDDLEKTLVHYEEILDEAARQGVQLAVFPEMCYPGYYNFCNLRSESPSSEAFWDRVLQIAEPIPGPTSDRIAKKAKQHGMHIGFTMLQKMPDGKVRTVSALVDKKGRILHVHAKHILTPTIEAPEITPGDTFEVTDTDLGKIGILVCADASVPETWRILAIKGAEVVLVHMGWPYNWLNGRDILSNLIEHVYVTPTRAVENTLFFVVANHVGGKGKWVFCGKSRIVTPVGRILAMGDEGADKEEIVTADVDMALLISKDIPVKLINRRRPEVYKEILTPNPHAGKVTWEASPVHKGD